MFKYLAEHSSILLYNNVLYKNKGKPTVSPYDPLPFIFIITLMDCKGRIVKGGL
jgi:hypothetical protein